MGQVRICLLLFGITVILTSMPIQAGPFDSYPNAWLMILTPYVRLGELRSDPLDPTLEYFEAEDGLSFIFYTGISQWQLLLSGTDFTSGGETIPLNQLEWKRRGGSYRKMRSTGHEEVIMSDQDERGNLHLQSLSFRLVLTGAEVPGRYGNTLTLSMVFP